MSADETVMEEATVGPAPIALDRDSFMRRLVAGFGHLNEGILGSEITAAYVMNVGLSMGAAIEAEYKRFWGIDRPFTLDEYAHVIVDLKQKIQGNFSLVSKAPEKVVVRTTSCPFDEFVRQSPSLCFMTSSVFGGIAARNFGYGKVVLHQRIALGDPGCYVTVHLQRTAEALAGIGREYTPDVDQASPDIGEQLRLMESVRALRKELSETSSRWEEVVHGAAEAIAVVGSGGKIVYANARWRELLGVEAEELVGGDLAMLVHKDDRGNVEASYRQAMRGERVLGLNLRLCHRDGRYRDVILSGGPVRAETGQIVGVLIIIRDVTEAREAQRLKDEFLATASHELRTPVTTIRGLTDLLLRSVRENGTIDAAQLARRLETIRQEADRLASLSTDLVDVTKLQAGKLRMAFAPLDLRDIAARCVERQQMLNESGGSARAIELHMPEQRVSVRGDRWRLEQAVANLLENAMKFAPDGSSVDVLVGRDGGQASLSVVDRGIGVPSAEKDLIFTAFYRGSNASSLRFTGLGLGLHLSRMIAEAHGGTLTVDSEEDMGAAFALSLPLIEEESSNL